MRDQPTLILFSGMGADERVFRPQMAALPGLTVPKWVAPLRGESLPQYAARLAPDINAGRPCFIGGASFGGMIAVEMARHLRPLGCFLIGSVRSPVELPARVRALRAAAPLTRCLPFEWMPPVAGALAPLGKLGGIGTEGMVSQVADADGAFLRWACRAVLEWQPNAEPPNFPIHQIHGDSDPILPWRLTKPDVLVKGGGHVLSLTHPDEVNAFLRDRMQLCRSPAGT